MTFGVINFQKLYTVSKKKRKAELGYSSLTDTVHTLDSKGTKQADVTQDFFQMMLLWFHEGAEPMEKGDVFERTISSKGTPHWKLTLEKL